MAFNPKPHGGGGWGEGVWPGPKDPQTASMNIAQGLMVILS